MIFKFDPLCYAGHRHFITAYNFCVGVNSKNVIKLYQWQVWIEKKDI
jgi:hypothetical protein